MEEKKSIRVMIVDDHKVVRKRSQRVPDGL